MTDPETPAPVLLGEYDRLDRDLAMFEAQRSGLVVEHTVPFVDGAPCVGFYRDETPGFDTSHKARVEYRPTDEGVMVMVTDFRDVKGRRVSVSAPRFSQRSLYPGDEKYDGYVATARKDGTCTVAGLRAGGDMPFPEVSDAEARARSMTQAYAFMLERLLPAKKAGKLVLDSGIYFVAQ